MKLQALVLSSCVLCTFGASIDADLFADYLLKKGFSKDSRITAPTDQTSPSAASALAYMKNVFNDELCGVPTQIYLENILSGKSKEVANAEATRYYINAYNKGARLVPGSACEASDIAWREAFVAGKDPTYESARAFIENWPGLKEGNPCAVSGYEYVNNIISGKSHLEADRMAMIAFADAIKELAKQGKPLKDEACMQAAKAFMKAIPDNNKPDNPNAIATDAFFDKIFKGDAPAYDPVCLRSLEGYIDSFIAGDDLLTRNLKAARAFFDEFNKGSDIPADSACAAATLAYAEQIAKKPSAPNAAGMIAYIAEAIKTGKRVVDPACAAATTAYWDAYIADKDEAAANEAAGVAYLDALDKFPQIDETSACAKSTQAYIEEFDIKLRR